MCILQQLKNWVAITLSVDNIGRLTIDALKGDASFRRYYRVKFKNITYIAAYSPPETEDNAGFIKISQAFSAQGLCVPIVKAYDPVRGFFLISDLGENILFQSLINLHPDYLQFYQQALTVLADIQQIQSLHCLSLSYFDANIMHQECNNFKIWFLEKHLNLKPEQYEKILHPVIDLLVQSAASQPQCIIHRDYHSRNLMIIKQNIKINIGLLDFQDAMIGPMTYDIVSLLRDCYFALPTDQVHQLALDFHQRYLKKFFPDAEIFMRYFDLMGIQRHLKASFIFARKFHRDGVDNYLADIPRTLNYIYTVSGNYPYLRDFKNFIADCVDQLEKKALPS